MIVFYFVSHNVHCGSGFGNEPSELAIS